MRGRRHLRCLMQLHWTSQLRAYWFARKLFWMFGRATWNICHPDDRGGMVFRRSEHLITKRCRNPKDDHYETELYDELHTRTWTSTPARSKECRICRKMIQSARQSFVVNSWFVWTRMKFTICLWVMKLILIFPDPRANIISTAGQTSTPTNYIRNQ
jgi:hypothetical protein